VYIDTAQNKIEKKNRNSSFKRVSHIMMFV